MRAPANENVKRKEVAVTSMLSAGNPYVLPSVLVAGVAYLALSALTDLSVLPRVGVLVVVGFVVPAVLNRLLGGETASPTVSPEEETMTSDEEQPAGSGESADSPAREESA